MNFQAEPATINTLFSINKQYIIPRYQRNFSWTKENIDELWFDLIECISYEENRYICEEYFIGTLVLAGRDDSFEVEIVDGQQRLTVITMFISAICKALQAIGENNAAKSTFNNYITGTNRKGNQFAKLDKQTSSNYFSLKIQDLEEHTCEAISEEDKLIQTAFNQITKLINKASIKKTFNINGSLNDLKYKDLLNVLIDLILDHLKFIRVNVLNNDDAYTIFEILNARGINLSPVDLIKNKILQEWNSQYPIDFARERWDNIVNNLSSREISVTLDDYFIHHWTTKFAYTSKRNLYKAFKKQWNNNRILAESYLSELYTDSLTYIKLTSPLQTDWPQADQKLIYHSLTALKIFNVSIMRSFLLSLFKAKSKSIIKQSELIYILKKIENFHFMFNSICSLRPSGLEGLYAKSARQLNSASNNREAKTVLRELTQNLNRKKPTEDSFIEKFSKLQFLNGNTKNKKLIQYIFIKLEKHLRQSDEFEPNDLSLEHIMSQSKTGVSKDILGSIGNLLPMGQSINGQANTSSFSTKKNIYQYSDYRTVQQFITENPQDTWTIDNINLRTLQLAKLSYHAIWS